MTTEWCDNGRSGWLMIQVVDININTVIYKN